MSSEPQERKPKFIFEAVIGLTLLLSAFAVLAWVLFI